MRPEPDAVSGNAELILRDAGVEDAEAIAEIHVASWWATYRGLVPDAVLEANTVSARAEGWRELLGAGTETILAVTRGHPVGFCALRRLPDGSPQIGALYLAPTAVRGGIGSALMREALHRLRARGADAVELDVLAENHPAQSFYARFGFTPTGERESWHGTEELRLRRSLAAEG